MNNGQCVNIPGSYSCNCDATGFQGPSCDQFCFGDQSCLNGGSCVDVDSSSGNGTCDCAADFEGEICETESEKQTDGDDNDFVAFAGSVGGIVLWVLLGIVLILLMVILISVLILRLRGSRAKTGEYEPRNTESRNKAFQIPIEFADLRLPKEERLI